jgi:hypothetical protein
MPCGRTSTIYPPMAAMHDIVSSSDTTRQWSVGSESSNRGKVPWVGSAVDPGGGAPRIAVKAEDQALARRP